MSMKKLDLDRSNHRLDVQGLRAVAVGLVVLYHAGLIVHGGFLGVDIFFVISGFVISDMISREINRSGTFSPRIFLVRRLKRLFPALVAMLSFVVLYSLLFESWMLEQRRTQTNALAAMFSISNWKFASDVKGYFDLGNESNPLLHTWSLGVEEQFYIFVPIVVAIGVALSHKNRIGKKTVASLLICGTAVSLALQIRFSSYPTFDLSQLSNSRLLIHKIGTPFYGTPSRAWEFLVGVLIRMPAIQHFRNPRKRQWVLQDLGIAIIVVTSLMTRDEIPAGALPNIAVVIATALALSVSSIDKPPNSDKRILTNRLLVWIGDRSYSWYLWHWPFIVFAGRLFPHSKNAVIAAALISIIPATISYRCIESPLRRWSPPSTSTVIGMIFILGLSLGVVIGTCFYIVTPYLVRKSGSAYSYSVEGCNPNDHPCFFKNGAGSKTVLLEGDSHARSLSYPVLLMSRQYGFNLVICVGQCMDSQTVSVLDKEYSLSVVVSMRQYQAIPGVSFDDLIHYVSNHPRIHTVLVADNPRFEDWYSPSLLGRQTKELRLDDVIAEQRMSLDLLSQIESKIPNISVVQTLAVVCGANTCRTSRFGKMLYADDNHLSIVGSNLLYDSLIAAVTTTEK